MYNIAHNFDSQVLCSQKVKPYFNSVVICCTVFGLIQVLSLYMSDFKYVKYLMLPLIFFVVFVTNTKRRVISYNLPLYKLFLINFCLIFSCSLIALLANPSFEIRSLQELYFSISPILCILLLQSQANKITLNKSLLVIFWFYFLYYVLDIFLSGNLSALAIYNLGNFILDSESAGESHASFTFGLLSVYFIVNKNQRYMYISLIMVILSSKRIVLLGLILSIIFWLFYPVAKNEKKQVKNARKLFLLAGIVIPLFLLFFAKGFFDSTIELYTGMSSSQLTQGRFNLYNLIIDNFGYPNIFGTGYGSTQSFLVSVRSDTTALHSDLLKIMYEFGVPLFVAWLYFNLKFLITNRRMVAIFIYFFSLLITDNVYIYFDVLFVFYLVFIAEGKYLESNITNRYIVQL